MYRLRSTHTRYAAGRQHRYFRVYRNRVFIGQIVACGDGVEVTRWYIPGRPGWYKDNAAAIDALEAGELSRVAS